MNGLNELISAIERSSVSHDIGSIRRAYEFAAEAYHGVMLRAGQPYILHPLSVAITLVNLGADTDSVVAGLLHDVPGDAVSAISEIRERFGEDVARLVDDVNKLGMILSPYWEKGEADIDRKLLEAMSYDVHAITIELADRLDCLRDISVMHPSVQQKRAIELMKLYIPIARRLGAETLLEELEDVCLNILNTETSTDEACMPRNLIGVYKPTKGLITLPRGATVIDFAYAAHTELGNRMIGARINGRLVPLDTEVALCDTVEIITGSPESTGPSRDWLKIAKTKSARKKIRAWFNRTSGRENKATQSETLVQDDKDALLDE